MYCKTHKMSSLLFWPIADSHEQLFLDNGLRSYKYLRTLCECIQKNLKLHVGYVYDYCVDNAAAAAKKTDFDFRLSEHRINWI